tara:strand:+ start:7676 stop:7816 length:141 start_codon:yes stop_codon:yes gene_type:complete
MLISSVPKSSGLPTSIKISDTLAVTLSNAISDAELLDIKDEFAIPV